MRKVSEAGEDRPGRATCGGAVLLLRAQARHGDTRLAGIRESCVFITYSRLNLNVNLKDKNRVLKET